MTDTPDSRLWLAVLRLLVADANRTCTPGVDCLRHDAISAAAGAELCAVADLLDLVPVLERVRALPPCCEGRAPARPHEVTNRQLGRVAALRYENPMDAENEKGATMDELMTPRDVAAALHVSIRTVRRSPLPWVKLTARCYRLRAADLTRYIDAHRAAA